MREIPFHVKGHEEDDGEFYALGWCPGLYPHGDQRVVARMALCFSPTAGFSRFSFHTYNEESDLCAYARGPDYSSSAEAALLDAFHRFGIPASAWRLIPKGTTGDGFASAQHQAEYDRARREFCRALYGPRCRSWTGHVMQAAPLFLPPPDGFPLVDAFEANEENLEMLRAMVDEEAAADGER